MKVILLDDVENLGKRGDLVEVKRGYARNFLVPTRKAVEATERNLKALTHQKRVVASLLKKEKKEVEKLAERIAATSLSLPVQVGEDGKLFGSVTSRDIAEGLAKEGIEVDRRKIILEKPLKELGEFSVPVKLHPDVTANLTVFLVKS